ncbi:MAG: CHC2 zinc finger domain-containing protein [Planctomycetota bacterium]
MPGVDFNVLRTEITMEQVLNQLGFQPTSRSGNQLHGPCPVHGSTSSGSRTLSVNIDSGRYDCHKCQRHGNQLELWAAANKLPVYEAAIDLCRALGPFSAPLDALQARPGWWGLIMGREGVVG